MSARTPRTDSPTITRLASRAAKDHLQRKSMPGGGEVFSGGLASRALKTLGARAMTVDNSIIVSDAFDPSNTEDQALYAHEQYHLQHSGGVGENHGRDTEEIAARQVERMVLHRAVGGTESHEATQTQAGGFGGGGAHSKVQVSNNPDTRAAAQRGYDALKAKGMAHHQIVAKLAEEVMATMERARQSDGDRWGDKKGFL